MVKQLLASLVISLAVTIAVNLFIYSASGNFSWGNFLFFGLFFGLTFPLAGKLKRRHRG
jgi:hypothetical protein